MKNKTVMILTVFFILYFNLDVCIFNKYLNFNCATCGFTTSLYYFIKLDFSKAFLFNILFLPTLISIIILIIYNKKAINFINERKQLMINILIVCLLISIIYNNTINPYLYIPFMN